MAGCGNHNKEYYRKREGMRRTPKMMRERAARRMNPTASKEGYSARRMMKKEKYCNKCGYDGKCRCGNIFTTRNICIGIAILVALFLILKNKKLI